MHLVHPFYYVKPNDILKPVCYSRFRVLISVADSICFVAYCILITNEMNQNIELNIIALLY